MIVDRIKNAPQPTTTADGSDHARLESERRVRLIADHIDEAVYLSSADFSELLYVNSACEDIHGKAVAALSENPRSVIEAAHPDDRERYERDIELLDTVTATATVRARELYLLFMVPPTIDSSV